MIMNCKISFQEWVILGVPAIRTETSFLYNNHPETYVDVTYTIMMRRRTLYYFSYLILPCVLIGKSDNGNFLPNICANYLFCIIYLYLYIYTHIYIYI